MRLKRWIHILIVWLLVLVPFSSSSIVGANGNPISESRASSNQAEPIITVGPAGPTLVSNIETTTIGPGMELSHFERFDARGWINGEVMTVELSNDQITTNLLYPGTITSAQPLSQLALSSGAIAGVNGDFFDINNTKAPLGTMIQDGKLLKGPQGSHTLTAGVDELGIGRVTNIFLEGTVQLPSGNVPLSALNQSSIPANGIGLYTSAWGEAPRSSGGNNVYEVVVQEGKVTDVSNEIGQGHIAENSYVLVGRGAAATSLKEVSVGDSVTIDYKPRYDNEGMMKFAVGGNVQLVKDGEIPANLDDSTTAPRTAVGFSDDGQTMILALVDGRQTDSRGMTIKEMAELMKEYGAFNALNIDGGGSSTMVARMPGSENVSVVNEPSDGSERSVPNGIGVFAKAGSGMLTGFTVGPISKHEHSHKVFPGLTRTFEGLGYDENYYPVEVGNISWQVIPGDVGTFDDSGVFQGKKAGSAVAEAQVQAAKGTSPITVLGELDRMEATESYLGLEMERNTSFSVIGYDKEGYSAPIEARDIETSYDKGVIDLIENKDGSFTVVPKQDGGSTLITMKVLEEALQVPVTIGLSSVQVEDFEDITNWSFVKWPPEVGATIDIVEGREGNGLQLSYDFSTTTASRAAYIQASPRLELPGDVQKVGVWVKGDGNGAWLRTVITDASNTNYTLTLADEVNWTGWKYVETSLPEGIRYPVQMYRIYPVETDRNEQYTGQLVFDQLTVKVPPAVTIPERKEETPDPIVIQNQVIGKDRWTFAVLADSQFVAKSPNGKEAQLARESLRQIVASNPDFLVINGDLVDTGWKEDFEFAKQVLEEEVGDAFPIYYIPGNHEIVGSGSLDNFLDVFENNRYSFDHKGTRFLLLDSSTGSFRTSDFEQLIELQSALHDAKTNPKINNVVVIGHHPTRDPLPTKNSQLSDRKEAELLEKWLTEFKEESGGKGVLYISGHAHAVHLERVEGVPYMVVGSAGKTPYGSADDGGFYAWTMFGVDPTPFPERASENGDGPSEKSQWIQAEIRPILESITLHAPATLTVGGTDTLRATGHQAGNLEFPLGYPASFIWQGSDNVFIGTGAELDRAKKSGKFSAVFNTKTNELEAIAPDTITIKLLSNNVLVEKEIRIQ
ncbi:phosphodiester glycosidase family protein [Bacillus carboniphilus]|uniref:Phosphodiester glycosidase family protein n=1 Tax=Bacillus carboniphilus TaxID=86663 RepID=A0ABN0W9S2_9BACI